jgi:hypothetical protein
MIAARMANQKRGKPKANSENSPNKPVSQTQAAATMNVSDYSVKAAKKVLDEGGPSLVAAVVSGAMSVSNVQE